jgi:branched-chain amino acid transport system ATP-binding protein
VEAPVTPLLDVQGLAKRFGGLVVTDQVDLQVQAGRIHALIGPNGAGKTTLVAQLAGQLRSDGGRVFWRARTSPRCRRPPARARAAWRDRSRSPACSRASVLDNLVFATQARGAGQLLGLARRPAGVQRFEDRRAAGPAARGPGGQGRRTRSTSCRTASSARWRWA